MILDPGNQYIQAINTYAPLSGSDILEIGCGTGRMTRDMAKYAGTIMATDLNPEALKKAKEQLAECNVEFLYTPAGQPDLPEASFDLVIYTLSLHHVPESKMLSNLQHSAKLLKKTGRIVVVEPGEKGSFLDIKRRFGIGSGDEGPEKQAAIKAMQGLKGWTLSPTHLFTVEFQFNDEKDFFSNKLPGYRDMPDRAISQIKDVLTRHTTERGIILTSERHLNVLQRNTTR